MIASDRAQPAPAVRVADERNAPGEQQVAGEQQALFDDEHQQVLGRVRTARVENAEGHAAEAEVGIAFEPDVRTHDPRVLVDPGEQVALALLEALAPRGRR